MARGETGVSVRTIRRRDRRAINLRDRAYNRSKSVNLVKYGQRQVRGIGLVFRVGGR